MILHLLSKNVCSNFRWSQIMLIFCAFTCLLTSSLESRGNAPCSITADFSFKADSGTSVQFTDYSYYPNGTITDYIWDFGDSTMSTEQNPKHPYMQAGTFTVTLTVLDSTIAGCQSNKVLTVVVNGSGCGIISDFSSSPGEGNMVNFTNYSYHPNGTISSYTWDFGDSSTSNEITPVHNYASPGTYTVTLVAKDTATAGCESSKSLTVTAGSCSVYSSFNYYPDSSNSKIYYFTNYSTSSGVEYNWDFGDGTTSNLADPGKHTFPGYGSYQVTLTVTDSIDRTCYDNKYVYINVTDPNNCGIYADFYYSPDSANTYVFYDYSYLPSGTIDTYHWDFGDSTTSALSGPKHTFPGPGYYAVNLTVTDTAKQNCTASKTYYVNVTSSTNACALYADFTTDVDTTIENGIAFTNKSSAEATDYYWDFGDGYYSYEKNPVHKFSYSGGFYVTLTVSDNMSPGCQRYISKYVQVGDGGCYASPYFSYEVSQTNTVYFYDKSYGNATKYFWDFGDGQFSSLKNPDHTYEKTGGYFVTLTISDTTRSGCQNSYSSYVQIGSGGCTASSYFTFFSEPDSNKVSFSQYAYGTVNRYFWDFGDGNFSNEPNPVHVYKSAGGYFATLTVSDTSEIGCQSSYNAYVQVGSGGCTASAYFNFIPDGTSYSVSFTDDSKGKITDGLWDFGDGTFSKEKNPVHKFDKAGGYWVHLTVRDSNQIGCQSDYWNYVVIGSGSCATSAYFNFLPDNSSNIVSFTNESYGNVTECRWDFGDGQYATDKNPSHKFENGGYWVSLTVSDSNYVGCSNTYWAYVQVGSGGCFTSAYFSALPDPSSNAVSFSDQSYGSVTHYFWDFGDGQYATDKNPVHKYEKGGGYYVSLTVSDSTIKGCQNTYYVYVAVGNDGCRTSSYFTALPHTTGNGVDFTDNSYGNVTNYYWDFGTGDYSNEKNPSYKFPTAGGYYVSLTVSDTSISGCQNTYWGYIQVGSGGCTASSYFSALPDPNSNTVSFSDKSYGNANAWFWDFGNGEYSSEQNPKYTYKSSGGYYVSLTVSDTTSVGCSNTYWEYVSVGKTGCMTYPYFTSISDSNTVSFTDNSYGAVTNWYWDFGTGDVSKEQNPKYTYERAGYYTVCLTISDSISGCQNYYCGYIKAGADEACQAKFAALPSLTSTEVSFTDKSLGSPTYWYWDFGDGNYSTEQNPVYKYQRAGYYSVCLYSYNFTSGCYTSYCDYIKVGNEADCQAKFSSLPNGLQVSFSDVSLGEPSEWFWDFGDGNYSYKQNPEYTYSNAGYYYVSLSIRNNTTGCVSQYYDYIQVGNSNNCLAGYKYITNTTTGKVEFTNTSYGEKSTKLYWDFGDYSFETIENPVHAYKYSGYYTVCLYTYDTISGCQSYYCDYIRAGSDTAVCQASFSSKPKEGTTVIAFADESKGNPDSWFWDFGDGTISSLQNPQHTYSRGGYYYVSLSTYSASGCQSYYSNYVYVGTGDCKASFSFYNDPAKKQISFYDLSYGNPTSYYWDLGDGKFATVKNPEHQYTYDGTYTVCLYTYDSLSGCSDYYCQEVKAGTGGQDCEAKFESFTKNKDVSFDDKSSGDGNYWFWDFGDNEYSVDKNAQHSYAKDGYYNVCLTTYNLNTGCYNTSCKNLTIGSAATEDCEAKFSYAVDIKTNTVSFKDESYGNPVSYVWKFGNSGSSTQSNPKFKFDTAGVQSVYLSITTASGCTKTYGDVISLGIEGMFADFMYKDSVYYTKTGAAYPVSFYGSAYGKPSKWKWAFGDGAFDSLRVNPIHIYSDAGSYNACLTISDPVAKLSSSKCNLVKVGNIVTGITKTNPGLDVNVYPNPMSSTGTVSYSLTEASSVQLNIIDMHGRIVKTFIKEMQNMGAYKQVIDITELNLSNGLYIVNLSINGRAYNRPLAVKR